METPITILDLKLLIAEKEIANYAMRRRLDQLTEEIDQLKLDAALKATTEGA